VIYVDSSVLLADLFAERRSPPERLWDEDLASSNAALARALEPFPVAVRTLDALHLATMDFIRESGEPVEFASYDNRLIAATEALGITPAAL
jgi:predicted nucleic acid-binding protein